QVLWIDMTTIMTRARSHRRCPERARQSVHGEYGGLSRTGNERRHRRWERLQVPHLGEGRSSGGRIRTSTKGSKVPCPALRRPRNQLNLADFDAQINELPARATGSGTVAHGTQRSRGSSVRSRATASSLVGSSGKIPNTAEPLPLSRLISAPASASARTARARIGYFWKMTSSKSLTASAASPCQDASASRSRTVGGTVAGWAYRARASSPYAYTVAIEKSGTPTTVGAGGSAGNGSKRPPRPQARANGRPAAKKGTSLPSSAASSRIERGPSGRP